MTWRSKRRRDLGSATVLVVAALGAILLVAQGALTLAGAVIASHRAHSAADLAALAGAAVLVRGQDAGPACERAATVAQLNGASAVSCQAGRDLSMEVRVRVHSGTPGLGPAEARSRAGPAPP